MMKYLLTYLILTVSISSFANVEVETERTQVRQALHQFPQGKTPAYQENEYGRDKVDGLATSLYLRIEAIGEKKEEYRPWCIYQLIRLSAFYSRYLTNLDKMSAAEAERENAQEFAKRFLKIFVPSDNNKKDKFFKAKVKQFIEEHDLSVECRGAKEEFQNLLKNDEQEGLEYGAVSWLKKEDSTIQEEKIKALREKIYHHAIAHCYEEQDGAEEEQKIYYDYRMAQLHLYYARLIITPEKSDIIEDAKEAISSIKRSHTSLPREKLIKLEQILSLIPR